MSLSRRALFRLAAGAAACPLLKADDAPAVRKAGMIVRAARPEDLEMPLAFCSDYITPVEHFFVRTHTYVPEVKLAEWRLNVAGEVQNALTLSMEDLTSLPRA